MKKLPERPPDIFKMDILNYIAEIQHNSDFISQVHEYNSRYLYWDELKYRINDPEERAAFWYIMKTLRMAKNDVFGFSNLTLRYSLTSEISKGIHIFDQYLSGTIRVNKKSIRLDNSYILNSLMEEAVASSILEGAATTRKAAKEILLKGKKPKNISEQMVVNNYRAMQHIVERKDKLLTPEFLLEIHGIITKNTLDDMAAGHFRTNNDIEVVDPASGTVYHTPPGYTKIPEMIEELCRFANEEDEENFIHPIIKGIILHFLIGYIHPFEDGNGRTARSIFYWYVLSSGYWLFEYMPISRIILKSKKDYALSYLYTEYDDMDLTYFILYNIRCIEKARSDLLSYIQKKQDEEKAGLSIIEANPDINQRQAEILRKMIKDKSGYYTIKEAMETFGVVYQTARTDLMKLAELGYLRQEKRGREFVFVLSEKSLLLRS